MDDTGRATYSSDKFSSSMATGASRQALPLTVALLLISATHCL